MNVLNPEVIVLGGLFGRIQPFVGPDLDGALDRMALSAPRGLVRGRAGGSLIVQPLRLQEAVA